MARQREKPYFLYSAILHIGLLLFFVVSFKLSSNLVVFENTNQQDVISAVVLGDTAKSHILPKQVVQEPKPDIKPEIKPKPEPKPKPVTKQMPKPEPDAIALKKPDDKKKLAEKKLMESIKKNNIFGKDLLVDINKQKETQREKEKKLAQKKLQQQTEESMRQQLLNEDIKLQGTQSRQSQGEVNKYKALILQAISEQWIIPIGADKRLYCELMIRLAPSGSVVDVQVTKSSGDPALDSSAKAAVMKASPLPVPKEAGAFTPFKQFVLKVKPENVLDG